MPEEFKMTVNEYMPLRDVVFHTLRQAILKGEMEPGERLMEIQLAKKLGVSRTPIREAIRKLELTQQGYVKNDGNNGVRNEIKKCFANPNAQANGYGAF